MSRAAEGRGGGTGGEIILLGVSFFLHRCAETKRCKDMIFGVNCVGGVVSIA